MAQAAQEPNTARVAFSKTVQCSPRVHAFYGAQEQADAVARAKSRDGQFYVAQKCPACSGWRLRRLG